MLPRDSYGCFRSLLKKRSRTLKSLSVRDGAALAFEFFDTTRAENVSPKIGDGLAYSYFIAYRGGSTPYEFSIIRLFAIDDANPGTGGSRLRLSFHFPWPQVVDWVNQPDRGLPDGNSRYAWTVSDSKALYAELLAQPLYETLADRLPRAVQLRFEPDMWTLRG